MVQDLRTSLQELKTSLTHQRHTKPVLSNNDDKIQENKNDLDSNNLEKHHPSHVQSLSSLDRSQLRRRRQTSSLSSSATSDFASLTSSSSSKRKSKIKLSRALEMVEAFGLQTCVARSICELACDPDMFGKLGRAMHRVMTRLNSHVNIAGVEEEKAAFYREAVTSGETFKYNEDDCKTECTDRYSPCSRPTPFMLRMASNIDFAL